MSSYREDTQETAVASNTVLSAVRTITEELSSTVDAMLFGLLVVLGSNAVAADEFTDNIFNGVEEIATAGDFTSGFLSAQHIVFDSAVARDQFSGVLFVLHPDSAVISDAIPNSLLSISTESVSVTDTLIGTRKTASVFLESATAHGGALVIWRVETNDIAQAADGLIQSSRALELVVESATASDVLVSDPVRAGLTITESATANDYLLATILRAQNLITEVAIVEDAVLVEPSGQAWTANTESWAMSRYTQYIFDCVAVINGVPYGANDSGVYALDGGAGSVSGTVVFGKLDLGGANGLVHPIHSYLEYEKTNGVFEMDVTTTQSGAAETFTYALASETADNLTNGRFVFGKGLRGRHFQLALRIAAEKAHINDWVISATPTKRRT